MEERRHPDSKRERIPVVERTRGFVYATGLCLVWAPPERDLEIRICVQVVYSGDDGGRDEAEKRMKTMEGLLITPETTVGTGNQPLGNSGKPRRPRASVSPTCGGWGGSRN